MAPPSRRTKLSAPRPCGAARHWSGWPGQAQPSRGRPAAKAKERPAAARPGRPRAPRDGGGLARGARGAQPKAQPALALCWLHDSLLQPAGVAGGLVAAWWRSAPPGRGGPAGRPPRCARPARPARPVSLTARSARPGPAWSWSTPPRARRHAARSAQPRAPPRPASRAGQPARPDHPRFPAGSQHSRLSGVGVPAAESKAPDVPLDGGGEWVLWMGVQPAPVARGDRADEAQPGHSQGTVVGVREASRGGPVGHPPKRPQIRG